MFVPRAKPMTCVVVRFRTIGDANEHAFCQRFVGEARFRPLRAAELESLCAARLDSCEVSVSNSSAADEIVLKQSGGRGDCSLAFLGFTQFLPLVAERSPSVRHGLASGGPCVTAPNASFQDRDELCDKISQPYARPQFA